MKVNIKNFDVKMEVKNKGIELEVKNTQGKHLGDLVVTGTRLEWCKGKTAQGNGKTIKWEKFIEFMEKK
jgi:hypothetical protein